MLFRHIPDPPPVSGRLLAFALVDQRGRAFGLAHLAGRVQIVVSETLAASPRLTLCSLARRAHVSPAELSRIRSGERRHPGPVILRRLAAALSVPPAYLFYLADILKEEEWRRIDLAPVSRAKEKESPGYGPHGLTRDEWDLLSWLREVRSNEAREAVSCIVRVLAQWGGRERR